MQAANRLQKALKSGKTSFGGWQMLPGANLSRTIARTPNLDWICVDCEHGNISDDAMHESVAAIAACGVSPVVRVADGQHWMIKRALDAGAHGIIVPLLQTAQDAKNVVRFSKFPPQGNRGLGSPFAMEKFAEQTVNGKELSLMDYYRQANDGIVVIVQIETASALEQIKEIAAVDGIDVLFLGPVDLGNSIGHSAESIGQYSRELEEAMKTVHQATKDAGKYTALYTAGGESAKKYAEQGFNMVNAMNDVAAIKSAFGQAVETARN
ncbi:4-hydroxy-2-oxo-heptane-1,7-dioate aldolase [Fulvia fulva]|uniref:4-hydroxy-2-oxo-heptane-1,7-dioate aldolase n=1 Tax=Passalora fulva TaxID=5499 RepID=A0A9Q8L7C7_PASFU|nr:4-hydroxy-2-oxo-heptane-1,7-dioate aldolase [Fulvia fulva]KAK4635594.1 4-hydroxy-2-oxo-heptane-1,7-dioate aldolase [Fulvia fulva]KAK4637342.1 4-hydroxy-2-oxo-heptane-1,7-dioate aldolase [Fulvia fulva]UJO12162.1 4-hydroxy-2-oxo-heptane-1,7-dioate aldolase [Fulvia fulva]WPV08763.1 4-hydroxy-2-oxo-heptane-1,7-dioate aldolase [Fulvia fulva]WPV23201.1 4-hydroxy-2-oxo-heptane-1,7-dioate aldolase [Fulvia fulva]